METATHTSWGEQMSKSWKFAAVLLLLPAAIYGQSIFGTILGTVTDESGAIVPGAKIVITNQGENTSRELVTDAQGNFEAVNLKAGTYTVTAGASGFKTFKAIDLQLAARQVLRVNASLQVGQITDSINVTANASVVTTDTGTIATTFGSQEVLDLPANYRGAGSTTPYRLLSYQAGIQSDNGYNFSVQGALPSQTEVSLDGISTKSTASNTPLSEMFPSAEGIAEMKVQGVGSNAEFGQVGDITTTSRGGSNAFHGGVFDYLQNRALDATAFGSTSKPQKVANDFGGSLGGPIIRNRTFFFVTFEDMQYRTGRTLQATVPTAAMRAGDFSKEGVTLTNPLPGAAFANNQIPTTLINPVATKVLKYYPLPNFGATDVEQSGNFRINAAAPTTSWQYDARIDETLTSKQSLFGRLSWKNLSQTSPTAFALPPNSSYNDSRSVVISHNYTLTPSMLNEFRFGLSNSNAATSYAFDGRSIAKDIGLLNLPPLTFNGLPAFNFGGATSNFGFGKPSFTFSHSYQWSDNLTWTKGRHTMKFGGDVRRLRAQTDLGFLGSDNYGNFDFDGRFSGSDVADFLLGLPYHSAYASVKQDNDGVAWHYAFFAQDSFKVNSRLTLEYGLRWEFHPPFWDTGSDITNFDRTVPVTGRVIIPATQQALDITAPGFLQSINACPGPSWNGIPCTPFLQADKAGWPNTLRFSQKKDFNPRFGFAYRPFNDTKTVIRGGFGRYTMTILGAVFYSLTGVSSSDVREFTNNISNGVPLFQLPQISTNGSGVTTTPYGQAYFGTANDPYFKDPYSLQWNLSVERDLGWNTGLRVSHIGLRSVQLPWAPDLNQPQSSTVPYAERPLTDRPFPYWGRINTRDTGANAIYTSMQTELTHRFRSGLTFDSSWTWAKNLGDAAGPAPTGWSGDTGGGRVTNSLNRRGDRGNIYATRRHRWLTTAVYELPLGRGRTLGANLNPVANAIVGGWRLSSILLVQTGPFLTPTMSGGDPSGTGASARGTQRPDVVSDGNLANPTANAWFDRAAFVCPGRTAGAANQYNCNVTPIARFGNAGVGTLIGPGTVNLSMGFGKDFRVAEKHTLKFEATFTNLPNHPNLADPSTMNITSSSFGRITSARGADSGGNRIGQFALRYEF
ncbi:MAG TPA: TonB-dependent receptor [Acidobacteriota bacterium]|nr:TonB-dependent receptor [Acidobacteriota bacterium]